MLSNQLPPATESDHSEILLRLAAASGMVRIDMRLYQLLWGDAVYTNAALDRYREIADLAMRRNLRVMFELVGGPGGPGKHTLRVAPSDYAASVDARHKIITVFVNAALGYRRDPKKKLVVQEAHEYADGGPYKDPNVVDGTWDSVALNFLRHCLQNTAYRGIPVCSPGFEFEQMEREIESFDFSLLALVDLIGYENYVPEPLDDESEEVRIARHVAKRDRAIALIDVRSPVRRSYFEVELGIVGNAALAKKAAAATDASSRVAGVNTYCLGDFA